MIQKEKTDTPDLVAKIVKDTEEIEEDSTSSLTVIKKKQDVEVEIDVKEKPRDVKLTSKKTEEVEFDITSLDKKEEFQEEEKQPEEETFKDEIKITKRKKPKTDSENLTVVKKEITEEEEETTVELKPKPDDKPKPSEDSISISKRKKPKKRNRKYSSKPDDKPKPSEDSISISKRKKPKKETESVTLEVTKEMDSEIEIKSKGVKKPEKTVLEISKPKEEFEAEAKLDIVPKIDELQPKEVADVEEEKETIVKTKTTLKRKPKKPEEKKVDVTLEKKPSEDLSITLSSTKTETTSIEALKRSKLKPKKKYQRTSPRRRNRLEQEGILSFQTHQPICIEEVISEAKESRFSPERYQTQKVSSDVKPSTCIQVSEVYTSDTSEELRRIEPTPKTATSEIATVEAIIIEVDSAGAGKTISIEKPKESKAFERMILGQELSITEVISEDKEVMLKTEIIPKSSKATETMPKDVSIEISDAVIFGATKEIDKMPSQITADVAFEAKENICVTETTLADREDKLDTSLAMPQIYPNFSVSANRTVQVSEIHVHDKESTYTLIL
ncbi:hypothetical protein CEXT_70681 [Caerostris extrusa]|nr:hypothetical protein CEXT_70681 [Caerostris extrusa]